MNGLAFWIQDNFLMKKDTTPTPIKSPEVAILDKGKGQDLSDLISTGESDNPSV